MTPKVVVIIVIWNGLQDTLECLESLLQDGYPAMEIVVVDNGSTDGSAATIRERGFPVRIVNAGGNLGFTGGNNLGLEEARRLEASYAFLLNNDTTLEKGAIRALVDAAELNPSVGIVAPVMHYYSAPDKIWFAGGLLRLAKGEAIHDQESSPTRLSEPYSTSWVSGCAMLVRMRACAEVGGLDDRFYFTWEDVDWSLRMRRKGFEVMVVPKARIFHKCGSSVKRLDGIGNYYSVRNSLLLAAKHAGAQYFSAMLCILATRLRPGIRLGPSASVRRFSTAFEGVRDHFLGRYGKRRCRFEEKQMSAGKVGTRPQKVLRGR
jgi:hypothetical protein